MYLAFSDSTDLVVGIKENKKHTEENDGYKCLKGSQSHVLKAWNRLKNERKDCGKRKTKIQRKPRKTICKDRLEKSNKIGHNRMECKPCIKGSKRKPKKHILTNKIKASLQETFEHVSTEGVDIVEVTIQHEQFDLVEVHEENFEKDEKLDYIN